MQERYEIGEVPPIGEVPKYMYASVIRRERFGDPKHAFATEVVETPAVGRGQVLVWVMAAGINYNNVWASLGYPVDVISARQKAGQPEDFHIGGSEGSGVVWAVGDGVTSVAVGDHVVLAGAQWDEQADDVRAGLDHPISTSMRAWGYETNYGSFAQFCLVSDFQCHPKPKRLTWAEAACFMVTGPTAYRQLFGWPGNVVKPGEVVLIWGGAGGLGSMAIQLTRIAGAIPIAVASTDERAKFCLELGAEGVVDRTKFDHWGRLPDTTDEAGMNHFHKGARAFGKAIWEILGTRQLPKVVLEHSGQDTLPTSMYVCDNGGMVVICGGSTGYNGDVDLRHLWMRSKRLQGSHASNFREYREVIKLIDAGLLQPCLSACGTIEDVGLYHQLLHENLHPSGNMAVHINATESGSTELA